MLQTLKDRVCASHFSGTIAAGTWTTIHTPRLPLDVDPDPFIECCLRQLGLPACLWDPYGPTCHFAALQ